MTDINQFRGMINELKIEKLSEICEEFLYDHEGAMKTLSQCCYDFGIELNHLEIKNYMSTMHSNGDFDHVVCFGIELSENQLYKKFHPA
tara:strand:+ start:179 stop:445 length:267 start_codon:yes stop_codon:yes gene_type:complete